MSNLMIFSNQELAKIRLDFDVAFKQDRRELEQNSLSLDKDASSKSPNELYKKLYLAREFTNRSGVLYSKYLKMRVLSKKVLLQKTEERRIALNFIFNNNRDELAKFRSSEEKNKFCENLLDETLEATFIEAKMLSEEADGYLQYFKLQFDLVKDIKSDILTQLGIIRSMMMLGELKVINDLTPFKEKDIDTTGNSEFNSEQVIGEGIIPL